MADYATQILPTCYHSRQFGSHPGASHSIFQNQGANTMATSTKPVDADASIRSKPLATSQGAAKAAGHKLLDEHLTCEIGSGFAVVTAPIARAAIPTEKELTKGFDLLYAYLSLPDLKKVKPGFYIIRVATPGYNFKDGVKVSFVDAQGKTVHTIQGKSAPLAKGSRKTASAGGSTPVTYGKICGSKKCWFGNAL